MSLIVDAFKLPDRVRVFSLVLVVDFDAGSEIDLVRVDALPERDRDADSSSDELSVLRSECVALSFSVAVGLLTRLSDRVGRSTEIVDVLLVVREYEGECETDDDP